MSDRDFQIYRREFWQLKRLDGLRGEMTDARLRGDPLAFYRARTELREFVKSREF